MIPLNTLYRVIACLFELNNLNISSPAEQNKFVLGFTLADIFSLWDIVSDDEGGTFPSCCGETFAHYKSFVRVLYIVLPSTNFPQRAFSTNDNIQHGREFSARFRPFRTLYPHHCMTYNAAADAIGDSN